MKDIVILCIVVICGIAVMTIQVNADIEGLKLVCEGVRAA